MVRVKPFAALRPPKDIVTQVAAPPYDVMNSEEARSMAGEKSLLHITRPEIDFTSASGSRGAGSYATPRAATMSMPRLCRAGPSMDLCSAPTAKTI